MTPEQIAACVPALQAWSTALSAAQKAVAGYATALTAVQQQLAQQQSAGATTATGSSGIVRLEPERLVRLLGQLRLVGFLGLIGFLG